MTDPIIDLVAIFLLVCIVGIAARFDKRDRSISLVTLGVMSVIVAIFLCTKWIILGILPTLPDIVWMLMFSAVLGVMLLGKMFIARGDVVIILITSVLVPSVYGIPTIVITLGIAFIVSVMFHIAKTFIPNLRELVLTRHIFTGINDTLMRKLAAFFIVHKKTPNEHFCFAAETVSYGHRRFILLPSNLDNTDIEAETEYVITVIPFMIPYFVGVCVFTIFMIFNVV